MDQGSYRGAIKETKSFSINRLAIESYQKCEKTVFQGREKHRYECNQACYLTKDPKTSLNKKNVKHLDPNHTYTLNKSNQFYISKTS